MALRTWSRMTVICTAGTPGLVAPDSQRTQGVVADQSYRIGGESTRRHDAAVPVQVGPVSASDRLDVVDARRWEPAEAAVPDHEAGAALSNLELQSRMPDQRGIVVGVHIGESRAAYQVTARIEVDGGRACRGWLLADGEDPAVTDGNVTIGERATVPVGNERVPDNHVGGWEHSPILEIRALAT
jgi:hypothetical protein